MKTTVPALTKKINQIIDDYYDETGIIITSIDTHVLDNNNLFRNSIPRIKTNLQINGIKPSESQLDYFEGEKKIKTEYK